MGIRRFFNFRHKIMLKRAAAKALALTQQHRVSNPPSVTVFVSSLNTRDSLELTLRSFFKYCKYPDLELWIGDNNSDDGSVEFIEAFAKEHPLRLDKSPEVRRHYMWLDEVHKSVQTKYWFAVDSDMLFLGGDVIAEMVSLMENDPQLYFVSCEKREPEIGHPAPVTGEPLDLGEAPGTWLMGVRTELREIVPTSFEDGFDHTNPDTGHPFNYDTGGKLLRDMREKGIRYAYMPKSFQMKYMHFGAMSWSTTMSVIADEAYQESKRNQIQYIQDCIKNKSY